MQETDASFFITCDDPEILRGVSGKERQELLESMTERITYAAPLWDIVGSLLQLPSYFAFKVALAKDIAVASGKRINARSAKGGKGLAGNYKYVSAIDVLDNSQPQIRSISPQHFDIEVNGHWRRIDLGKVGKGPNGEKVTGKTWIKSQNDWRNPDRAPKTIYIKSRISKAKLTVDELEKAAKEEVSAAEEKHNKDNGVLYVMRCITMKEEVYKVGWTSSSAEERAKQISAATGVPSSFVVVRYWSHENPSALEKSVHAMLDPYRLNDRREFFAAHYESIEAIIEQEISRFASRA